MTFRDKLYHSRDLIYQTLSHPVQYHSTTGVVTEINVIESVDTEFGPEGFLSTVQETETIYFVRSNELPRPQDGALIVDGTQKFRVIRPEPRNRYEWILVVKEIRSQSEDC